MISDHQEINEIFVLSFSSVFSPVLAQVVNSNLESETEMFSQFIKLKEAPAPGSEGADPKMLKTCAVTLSYPLLLIYVKLLKEGKLPLAWKHSLAVPLFK